VTAFFLPRGDGRFEATEHAAGPWEAAAQHGGPPAALLGRAVERCEPSDGMGVARITVEILGPVPLGEMWVAARVVRPGRSVELVEAELVAGGRPVMLARAWRIRAAAPAEASVAPAGPPPPVRPGRAAQAPASWRGGEGYLAAVEWRFARGGFEEPGAATVWTRLRVDVVEGEAPSPLQRVLAVADSGNGVSASADPGRCWFINPELTVHVLRAARGEWVCLDAVTRVAPGEGALARSVLCDEDGPVAYGVQALYVAARA
jgi:hypothetical protein